MHNVRMRHRGRVRGIAHRCALLVVPFALVVVPGLAASSSPPGGKPATHWVNPGDRVGGPAVAKPTPTSTPAPGGDAPRGGPAPNASGTPSMPPGDPVAKLPRFGPAPPPQPITVPVGPDAAW